MTRRKRPRMNITLDAELKQRLKQTADHLNVTVSRLIEEVSREFLRQYEEDPMVGQRLKKEIDDRKHRREEPEETEKRRQIKKILRELEET